MYRYNKLKQAEQSILKLTMIYECFLVSGSREKDLIRIGKKLHIITQHSYEKRDSAQILTNLTVV